MVVFCGWFNRQSAQFSFDVSFFFYSFLKKQDADLDVEKVS